MFLIYKFSGVNHRLYNTIVQVSCSRNFKKLQKLLLQLTYETRVFIIDLVWQDLFYEPNEEKADQQVISNILLFDCKLNLNKFIYKEPNLNRIKEILCSNIIYNIFATYLNTTLKTDYDTEINKILERVFIYKLQSSHHGITVISNIIVIDSSSPFKNQELDSTYRCIILIHEIGHLLVRNKCTSAQQFLEYSSRDSSFCDSSSVEDNPLEKPESGYQVEKRLFGKRVNILHTEGAKFLMVAQN